MKNLNRFICCLVSGVMLFNLPGCGRQDSSLSQKPNQSQEKQEPVVAMESQPLEMTKPEANTSPTDGKGGKVLVVYYSASGNTEAVAEYIAETLEADTFEITPVEIYTSDDLDWRNETSRVNREHDDPSLRTIELTSVTVDNWDSYDVVFIGYPIWWGIAAWPVESFVSASDFTGKTVIPFATSSSSGLGESGELLAELGGTGDWLNGQRFAGGVGKDEVTEWINSFTLIP